MNTRILYVFGNGFDLYNKLESTYENFHKYIKINHPDTEDFLMTYFSFNENKDCLWTNFENDLANFDNVLFFDNHCGFSKEEWLEGENPQWSEWNGPLDEMNEEIELRLERIKEAFFEWVNSLTDRKISKKNLFFRANSFFLSFNYTLTLENVYHIPNVLHLHGCVDSDDYESLIFGHGSKVSKGEVPDLDENGESNRTPWSDAEAASHAFIYLFRKPTKEIISKYNPFFDSLKNVNKVIILGHSLNDIDMPYIHKIKKSISKNSNWTIVYYNKEDKRRAVEVMNSIGCNSKQYELLPWDVYEFIGTVI